MNGMPLLSRPPPENVDGSDESACRRCNKEFNFIFARQKRCHHCGYAYCSSCADFQALMPRVGLETGYDMQSVCAYCIELLTVTAANKSKLRSLPLAKLRAYMKAYNISTGGGALEKDDLVEAIMRAKGTNGCLLPLHEEYYRKNSVPKKSDERSRSRNFFSRSSRQPGQASSRPQQHNTSPPVPPPQSSNVPYPQSQPQSNNHNAYHQHTRYQQMPHSPYSQYHPPPPPQPSNFRPSASQTNLPNPPSSHDPPRPPQPPPRPRSAAPTARPTATSPPLPVPSLDSLLEKSPEEISQLSIPTLKTILFENRVRSSIGVLEKDDLVHKVVALVRNEKRDREIAEREQREEDERMHWARIERENLEQERKVEERERKQLEERLRQEQDSHRNESANFEPNEPEPVPSAEKVQEGLCVVCCDAPANMAIIDCGHMALCKPCSEIVMDTTRECPLCRTRIVTEQRLLRIFRT